MIRQICRSYQGFYNFSQEKKNLIAHLLSVLAGNLQNDSSAIYLTLRYLIDYSPADQEPALQKFGKNQKIYFKTVCSLCHIF